MDNGFFKNIEKKTGVNMKDIFELANSLQNANFKDEKTVRNVIKRVSQIAGKQVNKDMEDQIVKSIVNDGKKLDFNTIAQLVILFLFFIDHLSNCIKVKLLAIVNDGLHNLVFHIFIYRFIRNL